MKRLFLVFLLLPISLSAQNYTGDQTEIDHILKNIRAFSEAVMNTDTETIALAYTKDAKILVNNLEIMEGRDAIKAYWTPGGTSRTVYHKINPLEISISDSTAYDMGTYEGTTRRENGEELDWKGKYVIIWKKIEGDWKIYIDIWNRTE